MFSHDDPAPRTNADATIDDLVLHDYMSEREAAHWVFATGGSYEDIIRWRMEGLTADEVVEAFESGDFARVVTWPR